MKAAPGCTTSTFCLFSALAVIVSGCAVGGKSFSIDSNSRVPFFGLELKERKAKSASPSFNSISRPKADLSRVETVVQVSPPTAKVLTKAGTSIVISSSDFEVKNPVPVPRTRYSEEATSIESTPIPMTDLPQKAMNRVASAAVIDFQ